jgi:hypothetical protein
MASIIHCDNNLIVVNNNYNSKGIKLRVKFYKPNDTITKL